MLFSVGILYSTSRFLELVSRLREIDEDFPTIFNKFVVASPELILKLAQEAQWIEVKINGVFELTEKGRKIISCQSSEETLRMQLLDMLFEIKPPWSALIKKGRQEASSCLPDEVRQCLDEANLLGEITDDVVEWWDLASRWSYGLEKSARLQVGREGERRSIEYESERTNIAPIWQALESNLSGYDILSVCSAENSTPLRIEVKASKLPISSASFHITRNEWNVAVASPEYIFHIWSLRSEVYLSEIDVTTMGTHVSENRGSGQWESIEIPFKPFFTDLDSN